MRQAAYVGFTFYIPLHQKQTYQETLHPKCYELQLMTDLTSDILYANRNFNFRYGNNEDPSPCTQTWTSNIPPQSSNSPAFPYAEMELHAVTEARRGRVRFKSHTIDFTDTSTAYASPVQSTANSPTHFPLSVQLLTLRSRPTAP